MQEGGQKARPTPHTALTSAKETKTTTENTKRLLEEGLKKSSWLKDQGVCDYQR